MAQDPDSRIILPGDSDRRVILPGQPDPASLVARLQAELAAEREKVRELERIWDNMAAVITHPGFRMLKAHRNGRVSVVVELGPGRPERIFTNDTWAEVLEEAARELRADAKAMAERKTEEKKTE